MLVELVSGLVTALTEVRAQIGCGPEPSPSPHRFARSARRTSSPRFPIRGSLPDRVHWTNELNRRLAEALTPRGQVFLPMSEGLTNPDGFLKEEFNEGNVHLDRRLAEVVCVAAGP